jgi:integrase
MNLPGRGRKSTELGRLGLEPRTKALKGASAYSFRHTRISELLQLYGVDPLTTAQQTGTSVAMIEKHYFKFISGSMRDKLNAVKAS